MTEIGRVVKRASVRLWLIDWWHALAVLATVAIALVLVTRLVERVFGLVHAFAPWWGWIFAGAGAGVVAGSILWATLIRRRALAVARVVDERAGLRESLSTALAVSASDDPWARAVVESATERARRVDVRSAIPYRAPRLWPAPLAAGVALMIVWMTVQPMDVLGIFRKKQQEIERQNQVVQIKEERKVDQQKLDELLRKARVDPGSEKAPDGTEGKLEKELDPESLRRSAVKELTTLSDRLAQMKEGEKAAQLEAMREQMKQLRQPGPGPLDNFTRELARGDFNKASQALEQLKEKIASGDMPKDQQEQLKKQAENLAKQLEALADQQQQVAKQLQKSGLDQKSAEKLAQEAASNPDALKKALEQMKNLSPEQQQQLMKMAQAAAEAARQSGKLSEAMSQMAQGMSQEGMQQEGAEAMQELSKQLSNMEMMQSDMENLDAALQEAKGQLSKLSQGMGGKCSGKGEEDSEFGEPGLREWREGSSRRQGSGQGGPGMGNSPGGIEESPADYTLDKTKANTQTQRGAIIGSRLVYGEQVKGESVAEFAEVVEAGRKAASESIEAGQVPRELQGAVKAYFSTLSRKAGDKKPTPTGDTKDAGPK